jgi:hypothetical protein
MKAKLVICQWIAYAVISFLIQLNYSFASEEEDKWKGVIKSLEKLHTADIEKKKLNLREGEIYIKCTEISLDNHDVKSYFEFSYMGGESSLTHVKGDQILKIPPKKLHKIIDSVLDELKKVKKEEPEKFPEMQSSSQAFGGKSSSVIIISPKNSNVYIRLGDLVDGFKGSSLGRIVDLLKVPPQE